MARGRYKVFNLKEAYLAKVIDDNPNSITGPTYGTLYKADCIKKVSVLNKDTTVKQPGDGVGNCGTDIYLEEAEVGLTMGARNDELMAAITGAAYYSEPGRTRYKYTSGAIPNYCVIIGRTDKTGTNGQDVWLIISNAKFGGDGATMENQKYSDFDLKGSAEYTKSTVPVVRDGLTLYENALWETVNNDVAESIVSGAADFISATVVAPSSGAPTFTATPLHNATNVVIGISPTFLANKTLKQSTVNEYTAWIALKATPTVRLPATVTLTQSSVARDLITINPATDLTAGTEYRCTLTTAITDENSNALASQGAYDFTTAS
jgi:hypothetical protein